MISRQDDISKGGNPTDEPTPLQETGNHLFPVFVKLETLRLLIIGGGNVGLEKLTTVLHNSPATSIRIVAITIHTAIKELADTHPTIELLERPYHSDDLDQADIAIAAVNNWELSERIHKDAREKGILINVADKPELCDFYLGSIIKKGNAPGSKIFS